MTLPPPSHSPFSQVRDALDNADRFYRVTAAPPLPPPAAAPAPPSPSCSGGGAPGGGEAEAFRAVALTYLASNAVASRFAAALAAGEVLYLGLLWQVGCSQRLTLPFLFWG